MRLFGNLHDACLCEIHLVTGHYVDTDLSMTVDWKTTVHMLIHRQYTKPSAIELRFEEVIELRLHSPAPNCEAIILDAAFFLRDGIYYWADNGDWTPESDRSEPTWVAARKVYWRDASEWIGPGLRYRAGLTP